MKLLKPNISVIIPAYNEAKRVVKTIKPLQMIKEINHIFVVDDGSCDATGVEVLKLEGVNLLQHQINQGKGAALLTGVKEAIKLSEIIVFLDADLGESSVEIVKLIDPILKKEADVTIAKFPPAKRKGGFGLVKGLVKLGLKIHTGKVISSALSGQRAFKKEVLQEVNLNAHGYGIELGMTIDLLRKDFRIVEVEVNMTHHETGRNLKGFYHRGRQFWQIFKVIIKKRK